MKEPEKNKETKVVEFLIPEQKIDASFPLYLEPVAAGFPSPAEDYIEKRLDLNEFLIHDYASTFFLRVSGDSMIDAGIYSGDILVVDKSLEPKDGNIVIAVVDSEFTVKRLSIKKNHIQLVPENPKYAAIDINKEMKFEIWGVVRTVIHSVI